MRITVILQYFVLLGFQTSAICQTDTADTHYYIASTYVGDFDHAYPSTLYVADGLHHLKLVSALGSGSGDDRVVPLTDSFAILSPGTVPTSVSFVHRGSPDKEDSRKVEVKEHYLVDQTLLSGSSFHGRSYLLLPLMKLVSSRPYLYDEELMSFDASTDPPSTSTSTDWRLYTQILFSGQDGGPSQKVDHTLKLDGQDLALFRVGSVVQHPIKIVPAPVALRGSPSDSHINLLAASNHYIVVARSYRPDEYKTVIPSTDIFVYSTLLGRWDTRKIKGIAGLRLFGDWLGVKVSLTKADHSQPAAERHEEATATSSRPSVRDLYDGGAGAQYIYTGELIVTNLSDGRSYSIKTGEEDCEVLLVEANEILYRVNDTILAVVMNGNGLSAPHIVVVGDDVPQIHWAI